jgi:hypothetical protein
MFEIGSSLEDARRRRGLELADVEAATRIRARYLDALEHERFDVLPVGAYRRSFLREYADFLELDGDAYVSEYTLRFEPAEPEPPPPPRRRRAAPVLAVALRPQMLVVGAAAALLIAVGAWKLGNSPSPPRAQTSTPPPARPNPARQPRPVSAHTPLPVPAVLALSATRGPSWLLVRTGTASGPVAYEGTLAQGRAMRFGLRRPLWIRIGAPWNLDAALEGRTATGELPANTGDVVATAAGLKPAA